MYIQQRLLIREPLGLTLFYHRETALNCKSISNIQRSFGTPKLSYYKVFFVLRIYPLFGVSFKRFGYVRIVCHVTNVIP